jgi:hypothetical protein
MGIPYEVLNLGLADRIEKMAQQPSRGAGLPDLPDFGVGSASAAWQLGPAWRNSQGRPLMETRNECGKETKDNHWLVVYLPL